MLEVKEHPPSTVASRDPSISIKDGMLFLEKVVDETERKSAVAKDRRDAVVAVLDVKFEFVTVMDVLEARVAAWLVLLRNTVLST